MDFVKGVIISVILAIPCLYLLNWLHNRAYKKAEEERKEWNRNNRAIDYYNKHHDENGDEI